MRQKHWLYAGRPSCRGLIGALGAIALGMAPACSRTVVVGTECPALDTACWEETARDLPVPRPDSGVQIVSGPDAASVELDAGTHQEQEQDAALELPAPVDAVDAGRLPVDADTVSVPILPNWPIDNPSFERNGGIGGDVVLAAVLPSLIPVATLKLIFAELPGWYACFPFAVQSSSLEQADAGARKVGDYLSFFLTGVSARQHLPSPILPKVTYALALDVLSESAGGGDNLFVEVRGASTECGEGTVLGRSPRLRDSSTWTSTCVRFTADKEFSYLLLASGFEGDRAAAGSWLAIDNLRQVADCPN